MPIQKVFFPNSKGMKLAAWLHTPEGKGPWPAVVLAHGHGSSKDKRKGTALAREFTDLVFLRFDFHGHGESEGKFEEVDAGQGVDDLVCALDYIRSLPSVDVQHIGIVGNSFGGLAALLAAALHDKVNVVVLMCPVSNVSTFPRNSLFRYASVKKYDFHKEAEKIGVPVLIIHGDKDESVPLEDSVQLARHLKKGILHIVIGGDHSFLNEEHHEQVISVAVDFIRRHI